MSQRFARGAPNFLIIAAPFSPSSPELLTKEKDKVLLFSSTCPNIQTYHHFTARGNLKLLTFRISPESLLTYYFFAYIHCRSLFAPWGKKFPFLSSYRAFISLPLSH